jgi:hypothetical protein
MPDENQPTTPSNGATPPEPKRSLRDVAEAAWDRVQDDAAADDGSGDEPVQEAEGQDAGQGERRRDSMGRFAPADQVAKPGEQSNDPAPIKDPKAPSDAKPADPAQGSNQPPQHWSEQDRQTFAKLDPAGQEFLLRRHTEMERDYQTKAQAAATAVQFTQSLAPIFQDPVIAGSLQQAGVSPYDAIGQWASFHRRAMDPNPQARLALLKELGQRMGLDPAATGQMSQPGPAGVALSEEDLKDPAIRYFADHISKTLGDVQALRGELNQMRQQDASRQSAEALKVNRWSIDQFADEKDAQGNLKHPHFDAVLPHMIELFRANPERPLQEAYDMAIWAVPSIRANLIAAERNSVQQQQANQRARQAVRSNVRGVTSPVTKPAGEGQPTGLRAKLEAAADEVGL